MADVPIPDAEKAPSFDDLITKLLDGLVDPSRLDRLTRVLINAGQQVGPTIIGMILQKATELSMFAATQILEGEDRAADSMAKLASVAVRDLMGVDVDASAFRRGRAGGAAAQVGAKIMDAIAGEQAGPIAPTPVPAQRFLSFMVNLALEGWLEGWVFELLSSAGGIVQGVESFAQLDDTLVAATGLSRLSRRALSPLVDAAIATPMEWYAQQRYTPKLLAPGEAIRQFLRGRWTRTQLDEELSRQGYSQDRIEALLAAQRKWLQLADLEWAVWHHYISEDQLREQLRGQGFDDQLIEQHLKILGDQRLDAVRRRIGDEAIRAYEARLIDDLELDLTLQQTIRNPQERLEVRHWAQARRQWNIRRLSETDLEDGVRRNIVSLPAYRDRLVRYGYTAEDIITKQLLLQAELRDAAEAQTRKLALEAKRQADEAERLAARAERIAALEAERARQRRGPIGAITSLAVRGVFSLDVLGERLALEYDPDVVDALLEDAADQRTRYLADQARRADLAARAAEQDLSISQLERAVVRGFLSPAEYAAQLLARGFDAGEAGLLRRLVEADLAERAELARRRAAAEQVGPVADLSLSQWERLVRRGVRSLAAYRAALEAQDFTADDAGALVRLLELDLAEDAAAAVARAAGVAGDRDRELSLAQLERLVKVGDLDLAGFRAQLVTRRYSPDAIDGITRLLALELGELAEQRRARAAVEQDLATRGLSLANAERAVREGVWTLQQFAEFLAEQRYGEETQAVLLALVMLQLEAQAGAS